MSKKSNLVPKMFETSAAEIKISDQKKYASAKKIENSTAKIKKLTDRVN